MHKGGKLITLQDGDVRYVKYLVDGVTVLLVVIGCVDDNIFGGIGCLVQAVEVLNIHNMQTGRQNDLLGAPSVNTMKILFFTFRLKTLPFRLFSNITLYSSNRSSSTSPVGV